MKTGPDSEDLELIPALNRAYLALRLAAIDDPAGLERLRLQALAQTVEAELRIQVKKRMPTAGAAA